MSTDDNRMVVAENIPAEAETPTQPDTFIDAAFYLKLQTNLEVVFFSRWGVFIWQFQFNKLENRMSKLEKSQNVKKSAEETSVELDGKMSMDDQLIGKFITQQVAAAMDEKTKQYENKIRTLEKGGKDRVSGESKKT